MMQQSLHFLSSRHLKLGLELSEVLLSRIRRAPSAVIVRANYFNSTPRRYFQTPSSFVSNALKLERLTLDVQIVKLTKKMSDPKRLHLNWAILRYEPGGENFQFSFTLKSGKIFNFDRSVQETLASFETRIMTNVSKKLKETEVTAKLLLPSNYKLEDPIKSVLDGILEDSTELHFKINDADVINVQVNPPEINQIKFQSKAYVGFPILPNKLEATSNFDSEKSVYKWEYTKDRIGKVIRKNKNGKLLVESAKETWLPCDAGDRSVFIPDQSLEGATIRLTCTPSDGKHFGEPFTEELPSPVEKIPVSQLLYEERLSRLDSIDSQDPNVLRIVSYNILADTYTTPEWFNNSPVESLEFSYRLSLIRKELTSYNADVICLQEVDEKAFKGDYEPYFKLAGSHRGIFSCKHGNTREGVATFYNTKKLKFVESNTIVILEAMKLLPFYKIASSNERLQTRLEDRNTVLQVNVLENNTPDKSLLVLGVTHLYFHPTADHIRLLQTMTSIRCLEAKVEELKAKYPDRKIRVFFCGDFNCTPPYGSYRLMTTGKVETNDDDWIYYEPEKLVPGIEFQHSLQLTNSHIDEELTNITLPFEGCIDYILYQSDTAELIKAYPPPDKTTIASIVGCKDYQVSLPNFYTPSDHLALIADFKLC